MIILLTLLFITSIYNSILGQVDTTVCYPLHVGDLWEYQAYDSNTDTIETLNYSVIFDTTLNNKKYFAIAQIDKRYPERADTIYQRVEDNRYVYQYTWFCEENGFEELYYDMKAKDSTYWDLYCILDDFTWDYFAGVQKTYLEYHPVFNTVIKVRDFTNVAIGDLWNEGIDDTVWNPIRGWGNVCIAQGIGIVEQLAELSPDFQITGAIIANKKYGIITSVHDLKEKQQHYQLSLNAYPNPCNSSSIITINSPDIENTKVFLFNILGQKIRTIETKGMINFKYNLDLKNLPAGIYFIIAQTRHEIKTLKLLYLK